jgi:hypothetical protein
MSRHYTTLPAPSMYRVSVTAHGYQTDNRGAAVERLGVLMKDLCNTEAPIIIARAITHCAR